MPSRDLPDAAPPAVVPRLARVGAGRRPARRLGPPHRTRSRGQLRHPSPTLHHPLWPAQI